MIQVYTGDGKGKTTAALGQCFRAAGHGLKSLILFFMKGNIEYGELRAADYMAGLITVVQCGRADFVDKENPDPVDVSMAVEGFARAREALDSNACDILVLDELCVALDFKLLALEEILEFLDSWPEERELIITGRYCPAEVIRRADLVSEMTEVVHYYRRGIQARRGFEF